MMSPECVPTASSISCPHPLQCTMSIRTSETMRPTALAETEQPLELAAIETDHHLAIYDGYWSSPITELLEFLKGCLVFLNVFVHEGNTLLRKKLFLLVA